MSEHSDNRIFKLILGVFTVFTVVYAIGIYVENNEDMKASEDRHNILNLQNQSNKYLVSFINEIIEQAQKDDIQEKAESNRTMRFFTAFFADLDEDIDCIRDNQILPEINRTKCADLIIDNGTHIIVDNKTLLINPFPEISAPSQHHLIPAS